ncbi:MULTISPECIES: conjugal transfer protein TraL [Enterobacteriaceae]|uniref:conjugal transfer protein TraL n=1 Tax=Enterobacteriaceae TaxID=543 RepID=UPI001600881F|nr:MULTISPECIES: conjugal transfer protein TraL [Enterobacteriaceae]MCI5395220.1 conjugal transfer protein TraL [Escherichia coli]
MAKEVAKENNVDTKLQPVAAFITNSINAVMTGKGGVGKSYVAQMLSQYFLHYKRTATNTSDSDPVNASTYRIKALNPEFIKIMENNTILQSNFDQVIESFVANEDITFVLDTGASTYVPLMQYFYDNDLVDFFSSLGRPVFLHTIIMAGQELPDTLNGFKSLCEMVKGTNVKVVAWINELKGTPIVDVNGVNTPLIETPFFDKFSDCLGGVVVIEDRKSDAFTADLKALTSKNLTLEEAKQSSEFNIMQKTRLNKVFKAVYDQLDEIYTA